MDNNNSVKSDVRPSGHSGYVILVFLGKHADYRIVLLLFLFINYYGPYLLNE
jgi:hypothetical protein